MNYTKTFKISLKLLIGYSIYFNRIGGVIVIMLAPRAVEHGY